MLGDGNWRLWHVYKTQYAKETAFWYNRVSGVRLSYDSFVPRPQSTACHMSHALEYALRVYRDSAPKEDAFESVKKELAEERRWMEVERRRKADKEEAPI